MGYPIQEQLVIGRNWKLFHYGKNKEEVLGIQHVSMQTVPCDSLSASPTSITLLDLVCTENVLFFFTNSAPRKLLRRIPVLGLCIFA